MNRSTLQLGNDRFDVTLQPLTSLTNVTASFSLNNKFITNLRAAAENSLVTYHDIQTILPQYKFPIPDFTGFALVNTDHITSLQIQVDQNGYVVNQSMLILQNAGRSKGRPGVVGYDQRDPIPFLTNQPLYKKTTALSNEWYFLPYHFASNGPDELILKVVAANADNDLTTVVLHSYDTSSVNNVVINYDLSPYKVLPNLPNDTVSYSFQVYDENDDVVSESRRLYLTADLEEDFNIFYENSYGAFDTLRLTGNYLRSIEKPHQVQVRNHKYIKDLNYFDRKIELFAGDLDVTWQIYLQELFISRRVFLAENGYEEIIPSLDDLAYLDSRRHTEQMKFEFIIANRELSY